MTQIRALQMLSDTDLELRLIDPPPPPGPGEVQLRVLAVGINHIDVFGLRGMAFAKRLYPLSVGAEAACQVLAVLKGWGWDDRDKLNVNGSGISLGHPIAATGVRILATMMHEMERRGARYGLETMCVGGGQGVAAIFERA